MFGFIKSVCIFVAGIVVGTVGVDGVVNMFDKGVKEIQSTAKEASKKEWKWDEQLKSFTER